MPASLFSRATPGVACVDLPAFPLQLVLRAHPEWGDDPVVVVAEDRPLGEILWANRAARALRIRRGMKFAHAQSLVARLHGEVVSEESVAEAVRDLLRLLLELTPNVEPEEASPGLYWLDPTGLGPLYGGMESWAKQVHERVTARGFVAAVAVGWQRGSVLAVARTRSGAVVLPDPDTERRLADPVPLSALALSPALAEAMAVLDVRTLGELLALPAAGLRLRYGEEAARLHALLSGEAWTPLRPARPSEPPRAEIPLDPPDDDHTRLLFGIKSALHPLLAELTDRGEGVAALRLTLELDHGTPHEERIEAAVPTLDVTRLVDLVRLRLDRTRLPSPVERIVLVVESRAVSPRQIDCLRAEPRRNLRDAARTIARVRAAFGPESVVRARLVDACLPEARYRWEAARDVKPPAHGSRGPDGPAGIAAAAAPAPLIRSVRAQPVPLRRAPFPLRSGPGRVRTGWWEEPQERDYYWAETSTGEILWVFRGTADGRWYLHGTVD